MTWASAGVDVQYLLTGQRNSAALSPSEGALLEQFRELDDHGRGAVLGAVYGYNNPAAIEVTIGNVHAVNSVVNIAGVNK